MSVVLILLIIIGVVGFKTFNGETIFKSSSVTINLENKNAKNAAIALNHMHASLNKIVIYNDKIVLEEEYDNIINNINLTAIEDREIISVITNLMDTLTAFKLTEMEKEQFQREYEDKLENSLTDALSVISANGMNPIQMGTNLIVSAGGAYMNYHNQQKSAKKDLDKAKWELEKDSIVELNDIRKEFLVTYWEIMQRYDMPDKWRITEKQFTRFINILKEQNDKKKFRQLLRMKEELAVLPTFWYELSLIAHKNKDKEAELNAISEYEMLNDTILRHNTYYSLMLANKTSYMSHENQESEIEEELEKISIVDPLNPERKLFLAMSYHMIGDIDKAETLLNENIDDNFLPVVSKKLKLKLFIKDDNVDKYNDTISELLEQQNLTAVESLSFLGERPVSELITEIEEEVKKINIIVEKSLYGKDNLIITLPKKWAFRDVDDTKLIVIINDKEYRNSEMSKVEKSLIYNYKDVVAYDNLLDQSISNVKLKLIHKDLPVVINFEIGVNKPIIDKEGVIPNVLKNLYSNYRTTISFDALSITTNKNKCFDVTNALELCKEG